MKDDAIGVGWHIQLNYVINTILYAFTVFESFYAAITVFNLTVLKTVERFQMLLPLSVSPFLNGLRITGRYHYPNTHGYLANNDQWPIIT